MIIDTHHHQMLSVSDEMIHSILADSIRFSKIVQKHVTRGLFKFTVASENQTRSLVCNRPDELVEELEKQTSLRSFKKMVNLLKTLASN